MPTPLLKKLQGLSQVSSEQLAQNVGMPAAPTTPVGTSGIGATPDSAKMAGSPAQKLSSIRQAIQPKTSLADTERLRTTAQATVDETQRIKELRDATQQLGFVNSQYVTGVQNALQGVGAPATFTQQIKEDEIAKLAPGLQAKAKELAGKVAEGTLTTQDIQDYATANALDLDNAKKSLQSLVETADEAAAHQAGAWTAEELEKLEAPDANAAASRMSASEMGQLQRVLQDPLSSESDKRAALKELRRLGEVGISAGMAEFSEQVAAAKDAVTIDWGGEEFSPEELLSNNVIRDDALTYLSMTDLEAKRRLREEEPEFYAWVESMKASLADEVEAFETTNAAAVTNKQNNLALTTLPNGLTLPADIAKVLGIDTTSTSPAQPSKLFTEVLSSKEAAPALVAPLTHTLETLNRISPEYASILGNLGLEDLKAAGLSTPEDIQNFEGHLQQLHDVATQDTSQLLSTLLPTYGGTTEKIQEGLNPLLTLDSMPEFSGMLSDNDRALLSILDADGDGVVDSPENIKAAYQSHYGTPQGAMEAIRRGENPTLSTPESLLAGIQKSFASNSLYSALAPALKNDRKIDAAEMGNFISTADYKSLKAAGAWDAVVDAEAKTSLKGAVQDAQKKALESVVKLAPPGVTDKVLNWTGGVSQIPDISLEDAQSALKTLESHKQNSAEGSATYDAFSVGGGGDTILNRLRTYIRAKPIKDVIPEFDTNFLDESSDGGAALSQGELNHMYQLQRDLFRKVMTNQDALQHIPPENLSAWKTAAGPVHTTVVSPDIEPGRVDIDTSALGTTPAAGSGVPNRTDILQAPDILGGMVPGVEVPVTSSLTPEQETMKTQIDTSGITESLDKLSRWNDPIVQQLPAGWLKDGLSMAEMNEMFRGDLSRQNPSLMQAVLSSSVLRPLVENASYWDSELAKRAAAAAKKTPGRTTPNNRRSQAK
jgi:hypothetical protein